MSFFTFSSYRFSLYTASLYTASLFVLSLILLQGCTPSAPVISKISGPTMGTEYHISWVSSQQRQNDLAAEKQKIKAEIDSILVAINKSMSTYDPTSELSLINASASFDATTETANQAELDSDQIKELPLPLITEWQPISAGLYQVLMMSMQVGIKSAGAFDVTIGPLVNLWGFGPQNRIDKAPADKDIAAALAKVGASAINIRQKDNAYQLKLSAPRYIDLSAIAKGYAVDVIAHYLKTQNIHGFLVEVGGEIAAYGTKTSVSASDDSGPTWRVAIEAPNDTERNAQLIIPLSNMAIATSGDYRNYFEDKGQRYSHTIDGRSGYPIVHNLASVSVLHESSAIADAWATALSVLGAEQGLKIAEEHNLAALFIQRTSGGFEQSASNKFKQLERNFYE